jgi:hypothetical protein
LAQQRQREHVLLQHLVRRLQARHSEQEFLHGLLVGRSIALRLHLRRKGLLVAARCDCDACWVKPVITLKVNYLAFGSGLLRHATVRA